MGSRVAVPAGRGLPGWALGPGRKSAVPSCSSASAEAPKGSWGSRGGENGHPMWAYLGRALNGVGGHGWGTRA